MTGKREVKVVISGDADGLHRELKKSTRDVTTFGDETGKSGHKMAAFFGGLAGGAIGSAVGGFLKGGLEDIKAAGEASGQTEAVLKSTGGAAGQTQAHIEGLADSIEKMSGVAAENVQAGQNMLLTFTNIKGTNFDAATKTMVDMSVAMGTDAKGQAIALGKALNDPIKGVAALGRVGVTFTDQQKAMIKKLQETGDMAGAQKIILAELNKEFGGSAKAAGETMTGKLAILQAKFGDIRQELVTKLLPTLLKLMDAFGGVVKFVQDNIGWIAPLVTVLGTAVVAFMAVSKAIAITNAVLALMGSATTVALGPIGLVIIGVAALAAGLIYAYKHSETFRRIVHAAFHAVATALSFVWGKLQGAFGWLKKNWPLVLGILTGPFGLAIVMIVKHWDGIMGFIKGLPGKITAATRGMWDGFKNAFKAVINWIIGAWNSLHFTLPSIDTHIPGVGKIGGFDVGVPKLPLLARGGTAIEPGWSITGDAGPELTYMPRGASVIPLPRGAAGGGDEVVHVHVHLDGRQIHESLLRRKRTSGQALGLA